MRTAHYGGAGTQRSRARVNRTGVAAARAMLLTVVAAEVAEAQAEATPSVTCSSVMRGSSQNRPRATARRWNREREDPCTPLFLCKPQQQNVGRKCPSGSDARRLAVA